MRRHRRFPLTSVIIVLLLIASVVYLSYLDVDAPRRSLSQVGDAVSTLARGLGLIGQTSDADSILSFSGWTPQVAEDAMPLLVNADHPLPDTYQPANLVRMLDHCDTSIVLIKEDDMQGDQTAVAALMEMLTAAVSQGLTNWQVSDGYRSTAYQQQVWDNAVEKYIAGGLTVEQAQSATAKSVARPGCSEHHTGLAFDITVPGESFPLTEQSRWLAANCWQYGFIIRYTEDNVAVTGINPEPWHIRYVGPSHAKLMRENGWALEEYTAQVEDATV